jgi:3-hydroxybutyryl-CoA dehydratase
VTVEPGTDLGPWTVEHVEPDKMKTFAVVLADPNPIHLDPEAVKAAGLGDRVINQGPASFGYVLNMLSKALPGATIRELNVRLTANVFGGDRVIARGRVDDVQPDGDGQLVRCSVWLDINDGRRALRGTATVSLPSI